MSMRRKDNPSIMKKFFLDYVLPIVVGVAVAKGLTLWVVSGAEVVSGSMVPTLPYPAYLLVDHVVTEVQTPYRGEVIIFHHPPHSTLPDEDPLLKRIIGLPGDSVTIQGVHVYINGTVLNEPYIHVQMKPETLGPFIVPANHYFVMGDNRNDSFDSRYWQNHYVPRENIMGRVDAVLWPPKDWRIVH